MTIGADMWNDIVKFSVIGSVLIVSVCKRPAGDGSDAQPSAVNETQRNGQSTSEKSLLDAQEFYEISKLSYLKKYLEIIE